MGKYTSSAAMEKFGAFIKTYNMYRGRAAPRNLKDEHWQYFGQQVINAAYAQYFDNDNAYRGMRPSNAYQPAIVHMLHKYGYCLPSTTLKWNRAYAPFIGMVTEPLIQLLMYEANVPFEIGKSISILDGYMTGTPDILLDDTVIDIKSMNSFYYKRFTAQPDNERGYITQLHLYAQGLGISNMGVLAICKDYPSISYVPVEYDPEVLDSVNRRIAVLNESTSIHDIVKCPIPPLQKGRSNVLNVPAELAYSEAKSLLYVLTDEDAEFCKTGIRTRTHTEILHMLADIEDATNFALPAQLTETLDATYA